MTEPRDTSELTREYEGDGIIVEWYQSRCIHSGNCVRALPRVFNPRLRPWVTPGSETADRIAAAVERCPSGALQYRRTDGPTGGPESGPPSRAGDDPSS